MTWRSSLIRGVIVVIFLGAAVAGSSIWREHERSQRIQAEIDTLKAEADKIRRENEGLSEKINYFSSPDFKEREAKEKLGFRRLEEDVVVVQGESSTKALVERPTPPTVAIPDTSTPNYRKWWTLFFH